MGTDIHFVYETKNKTTNNWQIIDDDMFDLDRNYLLFAAMAGVRNGIGFAGVVTHEPLEPIAEPRGFPILQDHDADDYEYRGEYVGDYGHSWLTMQEILEWFDQPQQILYYGIITKDSYLEWNGRDEPPRYSTGLFGDDIGIHYPPNLKLPYTERDLELPLEEATHVQITWSLDVRDALGFLKDLAQSVIDTYGEDTRIVFGFDS